MLELCVWSSHFHTLPEPKMRPSWDTLPSEFSSWDLDLLSTASLTSSAAFQKQRQSSVKACATLVWKTPTTMQARAIHPSISSSFLDTSCMEQVRYGFNEIFWQYYELFYIVHFHHCRWSSCLPNFRCLPADPHPWSSTLHRHLACV